ncbi:MAG: helix-turn-helix transcriptional regulator [Planctomycetota bacterium]|jgi:plasmid maintenance system antidote protein VapI
MGKKKWNSEQDIEVQLKQAILKSGISRYRLSQMTGVPASVLCTFVNGKRSITMTTAAKLAKALGLELKSKRKGR